MKSDCIMMMLEGWAELWARADVQRLKGRDEQRLKEDVGGVNAPLFSRLRFTAKFLAMGTKASTQYSIGVYVHYGTCFNSYGTCGHSTSTGTWIWSQSYVYAPNAPVRLHYLRTETTVRYFQGIVTMTIPWIKLFSALIQSYSVTVHHLIRVLNSFWSSRSHGKPGLHCLLFSWGDASPQVSASMDVGWNLG